jgi:hypothetical protein
MGEAYRADGLERPRAASLKFLGRTFSGRPDMLERLRPQVGPGEVVGTPAGMAPEQFEGKPATAQTGLHALGAENPALEIPGAILDGVLLAWVITRHGLLALLAAWCMKLLFMGIPAPFGPTSPWAFSAFVAIVVPVAIVLAAFRIGAWSSRAPGAAD